MNLCSLDTFLLYVSFYFLDMIWLDHNHPIFFAEANIFCESQIFLIGIFYTQSIFIVIDDCLFITIRSLENHGLLSLHDFFYDGISFLRIISLIYCYNFVRDIDGHIPGCVEFLKKRLIYFRAIIEDKVFHLLT